MNKRSVIVLFMMLFIPAAVCLAGSRGKLIGHVWDSSGNPIEGVGVTLTNPEVEGHSYTLESDKKGKFLKVGLDPILFSITLVKEGYAAVVDKVKVRAGLTVKFDFKMLTNEEVIALTPISPEEQARRDYNQAIDLYGKGNVDEAKDFLLKALENKPDIYQAHLLLGEIAYTKQEYETALLHLDKALQLEQNLPAGYKLKGAILDRQGDKAGALAVWQNYIEREPNDLLIMFNIAILLINNKQLEEARQVLERLLNANPNHAEAHKQIAYLLIKESRHSEARGHFEQYVKLQPDASDAKEIREMIAILPS